MTSHRSRSTMRDERLGHQTHQKGPVDPDVITKAMLYDHSVEINPIGMHFGLVSYAVASVYLHFSNIDRTEGWVTLGDHQFKDFSHLSWLVRTFAFCFLEWLAALVKQERGPSKFRVNISSGWANIVYAIGLASTIVLLMDLTATARYLIAEAWWLEIMVLDNSQQYSDLVVNLMWWYFIVNFLVAAHYARRFYVCMLSPLKGFTRAMRDQMRQERVARSAANSTKMSTDKSGTASDYLSPYETSAISANDLEHGRDRIAKSQKVTKSLISSIILHLGIWLAILHFTWPNVDLSENTSVFIYGAYISPQCHDVIFATILTVDIQWVAISVSHTRYLQLPPYQAGNSEVELRWLRDAILVLVLYPAAIAMCALAWQPLGIFRKAVRRYNKRLDMFSKQVKQAHVGDDSHNAPCQPANSAAKKEEEEGRDSEQPAQANASKEEEEARENQQPAQANTREEEEEEEEERREDHDSGEALLDASIQNFAGNDWELVEDDFYSIDASDALAVAASARLVVSGDKGSYVAWGE